MSTDKKNENKELNDLQKLQELLKTIFKVRVDDLDFKMGVHRIINKRSEEIIKFIHDRIPLIVEEELKAIIERGSDKIQKDIESIDKKIEEAKKKADELRVKASDTGEYKDLMERKGLLQEQLKNVEGVEGKNTEIFRHVYHFFLQYWKDGDFIPSGVPGSGKEKFCVPYDGSETYFHWATKDQIYVKSTYEFKKFDFDVGGVTVAFKMVKQDVVTGNKKGQRYVFLNDISWNEEEKEEKRAPYEYEFCTATAVPTGKDILSLGIISSVLREVCFMTTQTELRTFISG